MHRHVIDRWADTTVFRLMLLLSATAVLPVLFLGFATTIFGAVAMLGGRFDSELEPWMVAFALLSAGGVLGFLGYQRAHWGAKDPSAHNVTATLVCLMAGVLTALAVAGFVLTTAFARWFEPWGSDVWLTVPGTLFATANLVWAFAGIGWMQRLLGAYAEETGHAFDGLPAVLLLTAIALAVAATSQTMTL